jgi:hypothetical protein
MTEGTCCARVIKGLLGISDDYGDINIERTIAISNMIKARDQYINNQCIATTVAYMAAQHAVDELLEEQEPYAPNAKEKQMISAAQMLSLIRG